MSELSAREWLLEHSRIFILRHIVFSLLFALSVAFAAPSAVLAQSGGAQPQAEQKPDAKDQAAKDAAAKVDEIAEASKKLQGPEGNPECVWIGRRVVNLLSRDDIDTAFRHLDLYDRFGCPGGYIQSSFRCVIRQGAIDLKSPESLASRVQACWLNPDMQPAAPPAAAPAPAAPAPAAK